MYVDICDAYLSVNFLFIDSVIKSDPAEGLDSCSSDVSSVRNCESSSFGSEFSLKQEGGELKTELDCDEEEKPLGEYGF